MDPITFTIELGAATKVLRSLYDQYFQSNPAPDSTVKQINVGGEQQLIEHTTKTVKPIFGSYVTRSVEFAEYINDLRDLIQIYINKKTSDRPLNILLAAPPGSGKSFLIKQIIKALDNVDNKSFEEVYVAALDDINELYGIFQRVQSLNLESYPSSFSTRWTARSLVSTSMPSS
jgi:predicted ATPase with chaperone activity